MRNRSCGDEPRQLYSPVRHSRGGWTHEQEAHVSRNRDLLDRRGGIRRPWVPVLPEPRHVRRRRRRLGIPQERSRPPLAEVKSPRLNLWRVLRRSPATPPYGTSHVRPAEDG